MSLLDFFGLDPVPAAPAEQTGGPALDAEGRYLITISAACAHLQFQGCDPDYIRTVCHGRCCETSAPQGTLIVIHKNEQAAIEARGGQVTDGILRVPDGQKTCMFKHASGSDHGLCKLHPDGLKPRSCTVSPWTLSPTGCRLIVRNRYKRLICYKTEPALPAYRAFASGLRALCGAEQAARIIEHFDNGGGDIVVSIAADIYEAMHKRDKLWTANRSITGTRTARADQVSAILCDPDPVLTPVQKVGDYYVKRDDLCTPVQFAHGGKARTMFALTQNARMIVTSGGRSSRQIKVAAAIGSALNIPVRVHVPAGDDTPEISAAQALGAEIIRHRPGYTSVIVARALEDAQARPGAVLIPYAMSTAEHVRQTAAQVPALIGIPFKRIVVPVGSGMSLCGILHGLHENDLTDVPVLGVCVGADPSKNLKRFAPAGYAAHLSLVPSSIPYHKQVYTDLPDSTGPIALDPIYEAKCKEHLQAGDLLWLIG